MKYDFPIVVFVVLDRLLGMLKKVKDIIFTFILSKMFSVSIGKGTIFNGIPLIRTRRRGEIVLGEFVVLQSRFDQNLVGLQNKCVLDTRRGGSIAIGDHSGLSGAILSSQTSIVIGAHVKVGGNVRIFDHDFHSLDHVCRRESNVDCQHVRTRAVLIGDDVFIGTNTIILKGTTIGPRTLIAAGSVVFGLNIPPDSLVKGNPAVVIRR